MLRHLLVTLCLFLFATQVQAQNRSKQCTDVDANSVKQVQACLASSQMVQGLDGMGQDLGGCSRLKMSFAMLTGVRPDADSDLMPGCKVFAAVLENLNGKKPIWTGCIEFAENQTNLSSCYAVLKKSQKITNTFDSKTCPQVKRVLQQVISGMSGSYSLPTNKMPGCEKIAAVMRENNHEMSGYACGKYRPDSQQHINACLHSYFAAYKHYGMNFSQNCDQLRVFYQMGVQSMYDGDLKYSNYGLAAQHPDYQVAQCGMLEAAVASYNAEEYDYEKFDNTDVEETPARKTSRQTVSDDEEPVRQTSRRERVRETVEEEEEPADAKSILKQVALNRAGESKTVNRGLEKAAEYEEQYDELTAEEEEAEEEEEEEVTVESVKQETKKKLKKKLFDKLGL